ncbi:MAG TPA: ATP-binding protein [Mucilaginibacter sp.]
MSVILLLCTFFAGAQQSKIARLKNLISNTKKDTAKIALYEKLGQAYRDENKIDSSVFSYQHAVEVNEKNNFSLTWQCWDTGTIDYLLFEMGNYTASINYASRHAALSEKLNNVYQLAAANLVFGLDYRELGYYRESLKHLFKAKQIFTSYSLSRHEAPDNAYLIQCIGYTYLKMKLLDSALMYTQQAYKLELTKSSYVLILYSWRIFGDIYLARGDNETALNYYRRYISNFVKYKEKNRDQSFVLINVARIFKKSGQVDSAIFYAKKALANAQKYSDQQNIYNASTVLYDFYKGGEDYKTAPGIKGNPNNIGGVNKNKIISTHGFGKTKIDSLKNLISNTKKDTAKIDLYEKLGQAYRDNSKVDSSIQSYQQALEILSHSKQPSLLECYDLATLDFLCNATGNYSLSMQYAFRALELSKQLKDAPQEAFALATLANNYQGMGDYRKALDYDFKAKKVFETYESGAWAIQNIAETYLKMHMPDSALYYNKIAYHIADTEHNQQYMKDFAIRVFATIYAEKGEDKTALNYYRRFVSDFYRYNLNNREIDRAYLGMAKLYRKDNKIDSSIFYAENALKAAKIYNDQQHILLTSKFLYTVNDSLHSEAKAFSYFKIATAAKDSMASIEKVRQVQNLTFSEQVREKQQAAADAKEAAQKRLIIIIAAIVISILSFLIWNRIRQLRLRYKMRLEQKELEKLKAIDKMKEKFFSNITHELRTPLSLIMSPAQFYLEHPEELKDSNKLLESIFKNSGYLLNLINQLLDISKLDAGKMTITLSKGDFGNYIGDFVKTFEDQAVKKQIGLHFDNTLEGEYLFDEEHWKKIINNLVGNSLKFTPAIGNVFIRVSKIEASAASATIQFTVKDTGIGIDENELPFITDRFYQADNKLSRKYEGTGIGLALVSELVKLMDGKLTIESEKGKGSIFTITATLLSATGKESYPEVTPVAKTKQLLNNTASNTYFPKEQADNVPVTLVVEDNKELRDFLKDSIASLYKVITASNGAEGFEMALSQIPDLILSDVMMPVMDGFEFCDKIKTNPATSHIPFIILSAKTTYESKITGLQKGADDYLTKPFSVDELRTKIKNILHGQEMLRKRYVEQLTDENPLPQYAEMQDEFLKRTFKIIEEHIDDSQLSVEMLAAKMDLNDTALNRKFSFFLGLSANELIRQFRSKKEKMEHNLLELEAKTLRAQMNPHFIFNCMNSIKSLIQQDEGNKAVTYLTTFSKLLRTILQNSDEREVTLYDELETCKLYVQLEAMRFGDKFNYQFNIDESTDLKSIKVPALIIQPFIENAIWHGIMPRDGGGMIHLSVITDGNSVRCIVDDNGIGRERSKQNEFKMGQPSHQSKGICLTQNRLNLDSLLNSRNSHVEIIDKYDEHKKAAGTKVIVTFNQY